MRTEQAAGWDEFGRELRRLREHAGFTQAQLAARLGYDHTHLSKLEGGARLPRIELARQADALLGADGVLLALAANIRARGSSTKDGGISTGLPLPIRPTPPIRCDCRRFGESSCPRSA